MQLAFSMRSPFSAVLLDLAICLQVLDAVLNFLDSPGKFVRITIITAVGTGITIRFEPADVLFAIVTAPRTGNLDGFLLKHTTFLGLPRS